MKLNASDGINYLTNAEWVATKVALLANPAYDTAKFYLVDTKISYIIYSGVEYGV